MFARRVVVVALVAIAAVLVVRPASLTAQDGFSRLQLTATRIEAFAEASRRRLNYMPGEVIVKFKPGATVLGWQRALSSLRSRPTVGQLRWHGQFAALTDTTEPDAYLLASRLREQPEVEFAQPNFIRRQPGHFTGAVRPLESTTAGEVAPAVEPTA